MATSQPENTPSAVLIESRDEMSIAGFPLSAQVPEIAIDIYRDPARLELLGAAVQREIDRRRQLLTTATARGAHR